MVFVVMGVEITEGLGMRSGPSVQSETRARSEIRLTRMIPDWST